VKATWSSAMKPKSSQPNTPSQRQLRVGEEIRHALADALLRTEFHDKVLAREKLTVSEVRMSPDLRHALVFATVLGHKDITPLLPALKRVAPFLRAQIAPRLGLRVSPELKFVKDEALEQATKINKLLHKAEVARDLTAESKAAALKAEQEEAAALALKAEHDAAAKEAALRDELPDTDSEETQGADLHAPEPEAPDSH
jgi:ribosome-binding factor A